jgi:hypothetical protein
MRSYIQLFGIVKELLLVASYRKLSYPTIFAFPFANHSWLDLTPILLITRGRVMLVLPANNAHADRLPKLVGYGAQKACGG